ncbi:olfactory receptor 13D1-like, partial [Microcaecilia unicolor]|uniref:Olfactory receptor n=1 Tax=Microcaecilia unicolor TaxID=1415580 RepID=A0A6P7XLQ3_9AMPH
METENQTKITEFILLGLTDQSETQHILFVVFLLVYVVILSANALIIVVTWKDQTLHTPMYFFLCILSSLDICYSSSCIPKMLKDLLSEWKTISFSGCVVQMYIALAFGLVEYLLLAVMAWDRYMAISQPLKYTIIMNWSVCVNLTISVWITGFVLSITAVALMLTLPFCGHNRTNHFMCEVITVIRLTCIDIHPIDVAFFMSNVLVIIIPLSVIIFSYIHIITSVLKISSTDGRRKAFSTCSSHLTVVILFYCTAMGVYLRPRSMMSEKDKIISLVYVVLAPMLNPLIYTLRNSEVKEALKKTMRRKK